MTTPSTIDRFIADSHIGRMTVNDLKDAFAGFPIPPNAASALLREIQLAVITSEVVAGPAHREISTKMRRIAESVASIRAEIADLCQRSPYWLEVAARERAGGIGGRYSGGIAPVVFPDFDRFMALTNELRWAEQFVTEAAALIPKQKPRWRERSKRNRFVLLARKIAPVYETVTGKDPTVDNWPESKSLGPWPMFYLEIVKLAWGITHVPDLRGLLEEARRRP